MPKKKDLPAMPFYVGDWLKCPEVRALAPDYRGLWFDMLCYMWESTERGVMVNPVGKPYTKTEIVRIVGLDNNNSGLWLDVLIDTGVCSVREDGAVYSRKMVKDEYIRQVRRESGAKGGNPSLKKTKTKVIKYADTVKMTDDEYNKLISGYGEKQTLRMIELLDNYKVANGKTYKSDYRAILNWVVDKYNDEQKKHGNQCGQIQNRPVAADPKQYKDKV